MKITKSEFFLIFLLISSFILIRSLHFSEVLNFSQDQGMISLQALEIFQDKKITLIGPPVISFNLDGRMIFYGSIFYYFQLLFLIIGNFDPIKSSYFFMLFSSLSIIPLFLATKVFINKKGAILISIIFTFLPYYIDYTRFLWNPNYQLVLLPYAFLLLSLYKITKNTKWIFLNGIYIGILIPLHYLLVIPAALEIIYFKIIKIKSKTMLLYFLGIILGLSPLIIFELRNDFYNLNTIFLFINNINQVLSQKSGSALKEPHYFLTYSLIILLILLHVIRNKITNLFLITFTAILILSSLLIYIPTPKQAFRMPSNWSYSDELTLYTLIKNNLPSGSFNITNLGYNTVAWVPKFMLLRDGIKTTGDDYYNNKFLFVINEDEQYMKNYAYEVNKFRPSKKLNSWKINQKYNLYLLEKLPTSPPPQF